MFQLILKFQFRFLEMLNANGTNIFVTREKTAWMYW